MKNALKLGVVVYICNASGWEAEVLSLRTAWAT
jgi:hypothetical protein